MKKTALITLLVLAFVAMLSAAYAQLANLQINVMPAAVRTAAQVNSADVANNYYRGAHIIVTVTGYVSGNYTVTVQSKNTATGNYYDLLTSPAITANGQMVLKIHPGIAGVANGATSDFLPQIWRVQLNGASTPNMTVAVDAVLTGG